MIKIALKNIRFLEKIAEIPILKHFFILKMSENFNKTVSEPVLDKFYKDLYVNSRTSKQTDKYRFTDLNEYSYDLLKNQKTPVIHDVAVSNGISSSEFHNFLEKRSINSEFYISDKYTEIHVKKGFVTKVYNAENQLLFAYFGCFFAGDKNIYFPLTVLLFRLLQKSKAPEKFNYSQRLLHPEVIEKINKKEIEFIDYDIFNTKINEQFTFVRAMNILNLGYFSEEKIKLAVQNILKSMKENALLLIGRTDATGKNNAGFYKKSGNKLIPVKDINAGSEIKHIIEHL